MEVTAATDSWLLELRMAANAGTIDQFASSAGSAPVHFVTANRRQIGLSEFHVNLSAAAELLL